MKKNVLFVTSFWPYPVDDGGRVVASAILKSFSKFAHLTIVSTLQGPQEVSMLNLDQYSNSKLIFARWKRRGPMYVLKTWIRFKPYFFYRDYDSEVSNMIADLMSKNFYDMIVLDRGMPLIYVEQMRKSIEKSENKAKLVYFSHNVEQYLIKHYIFSERNIIKRIFKLLFIPDYFLAKRFEKTVLREIDIITCISDQDLKEFNGMGLSNTERYPAAFLSSKKKYPLKLDPNSKKICLVSNFKWFPNMHGIIWFIENVWPKVVNEEPKSRLLLAGKIIPENLYKRIANDKTIQIKEYIDDLDDFYRECALSIIPIFIGSGLPIKSLDLMQRGIPFVSTTYVIDKLDKRLGKSICHTNDPQIFAKKIICLLRNPKERLKLQNEIYSIFQNNYEVQSLDEYISNLLNDKAKEPSN